jgi:hypothetical protein
MQVNNWNQFPLRGSNLQWFAPLDEVKLIDIAFRTSLINSQSHVIDRIPSYFSKIHLIRPIPIASFFLFSWLLMAHASRFIDLWSNWLMAKFNSLIFEIMSVPVIGLVRWSKLWIDGRSESIRWRGVAIRNRLRRHRNNSLIWKSHVQLRAEIKNNTIERRGCIETSDKDRLVDKYMPQPHALRSEARFSRKCISRIWIVGKVK